MDVVNLAAKCQAILNLLANGGRIELRHSADFQDFYVNGIKDPDYALMMDALIELDKGHYITREEIWLDGVIYRVGIS